VTDQTTQFGPATPPGSTQLFAPDEIRHAVDRLGLSIRECYGQGDLTVVVALKGALVFAADLIRRLDMPIRLRTVTARSYREESTLPGTLDLDLSGLGELHGRDVLIVDDILDTGRTMSALLTEVRKLSPTSLRSAVLLDKPSRREVPVQADFTGFHIEDHFVVGYGLDHDGLYRNFPFIVALGTGRD
jgi:hypoxanthine phosphoribosyltransferase